MFGTTVTIQEVNTIPSMGAILGTSHSADALAELRSRSGGGVIFGDPGDPFTQRYNHLKNVYLHNLELTNDVVRETGMALYTPSSGYMAITNEAMLYNVPEPMKLPILMFEPISDLLKEGRIYGYGIKPENLPDEDVYGRLINNGRATPEDEFIKWTWKSDDPNVTDQNLEDIETTRKWLAMFVMEQMKPDGNWKDPTDPANQISRKRKKQS